MNTVLNIPNDRAIIIHLFLFSESRYKYVKLTHKLINKEIFFIMYGGCNTFNGENNSINYSSTGLLVFVVLNFLHIIQDVVRLKIQ